MGCRAFTAWISLIYIYYGFYLHIKDVKGSQKRLKEVEGGSEVTLLPPEHGPQPSAETLLLGFGLNQILKT